MKTNPLESVIKYKRIFQINTLMLVLLAPQLQAEGLGRLFTTAGERATLERLRNPAPKQETTKQIYEPITIVDHSKFEPPQEKYKHEVVDQFQFQPEPKQIAVKTIPEPKPEIVIIPAPDIPNITVNGFVKRSGGRNTAWVNGMNTNDGYFEPQHIKVNPNRIGRDHVHVEVDDINIGDVSLKVGQTLDPKAEKISDSYQKMLEHPNK
ncbi:MAG: hypothetical protein AB8D52_03795 [Gammaproteobacteria bacterium]